MAYVVTNRFPLPTISRADGTLGAYVQASPVTSGPRFIWPAERIAIYQAQQKAALAAKRKKSFLSLGDITCTIDPVTGGRVCSSSLIPTPPPAPVQTSAPACPACPPPQPCPAPQACAPCPPPRRIIPFRTRILPFVARRVRALSGLRDGADDTHVGPDGCVYDNDGNRLTCPGAGGVQMPSADAKASKLLEQALNFFKGQAAAAAANSGKKAPEPKQPQSQQPDVPQTWPAFSFWAVQNKGTLITGGLAVGALLLGVLAGKGRR